VQPLGFEHLLSACATSAVSSKSPNIIDRMSTPSISPKYFECVCQQPNHPVRCFGVLQRLSRKARHWRGFSSSLKRILVSVHGSAAFSALGLWSQNSRSWRDFRRSFSTEQSGRAYQSMSQSDLTIQHVRPSSLRKPAPIRRQAGKPHLRPFLAISFSHFSVSAEKCLSPGRLRRARLRRQKSRSRPSPCRLGREIVRIDSHLARAAFVEWLRFQGGQATLAARR
jgi:hypothetical protein